MRSNVKIDAITKGTTARDIALSEVPEIPHAT